VRMSDSTCREAMYHFCEDVITVFGKHYLKEINTKYTARLLCIDDSRRFPRMLGCIYDMHSQWKNCSFVLQEKFKGHAERCTVILDVVASHDL
jgi:hypothetical protein